MIKNILKASLKLSLKPVAFINDQMNYKFYTPTSIMVGKLIKKLTGRTHILDMMEAHLVQMVRQGWTPTQVTVYQFAFLIQTLLEIEEIRKEVPGFILNNRELLRDVYVGAQKYGIYLENVQREYQATLAPN